MENNLLGGHFSFQLPALVNFVGGGGKTSLILALMREYGKFCSVLYTTTTRIHPPAPSRSLALIASDSAEILQCILDRVGKRLVEMPLQLVVTHLQIAPDLLKGVAPDFAESVARDLFPLILNEADGARGISLKVPREGEPVLMKGAQYLVPVIGVDCLGAPMGPQTIFRWDIASRRHSLEEGRILEPELAAELLLHREGVCKGWEPGMSIIPFINKVDSEAEDALARQLARALLGSAYFPVDRVVWGSLASPRAASLRAPVA